MPNYCKNRISLSGPEEDIESLLNLIRSDDSLFDFENVIPTPEEYLENGKWYDWRVEYWGTKWNCSDVSINGNSIEFLTAWSPCPPILKRLSEMFPSVKIEYEYFEPEMWFAGEGVYYNGELAEVGVSLSDKEIMRIAEKFDHKLES